jgi:hypothetical protein
MDTNIETEWQLQRQRQQEVRSQDPQESDLGYEELPAE